MLIVVFEVTCKVVFKNVARLERWIVGQSKYCWLLESGLVGLFARHELA